MIRMLGLLFLGNIDSHTVVLPDEVRLPCLDVFGPTSCGAIGPAIYEAGRNSSIR